MKSGFSILIGVLICWLAAAAPIQQQQTAALKRRSSDEPTPVAVDLLIHCEDGADNDIITAASAALGAVQDISGTWSISPSPLTAFTVEETALAALLVPVVIGGMEYDGGGGTRSWKVDHSGATQSILFRKNSVTGNVSWGGWMKSTLPGVTAGGNYDLLDITGARTAGGTTTCVIQINDTSGVITLRAHASSPTAGSTFGTGYTATTDTLYWVTGLFDSVNGLCTVNIYSAAGALLHQSQCVVDTGGLNSVFLRLNPSEHSLNPASVTLFDNVIFDWTNAVFPLGIP